MRYAITDPALILARTEEEDEELALAEQEQQGQGHEPPPLPFASPISIAVFMFGLLSVAYLLQYGLTIQLQIMRQHRRQG